MLKATSVPCSCQSRPPPTALVAARRVASATAAAAAAVADAPAVGLLEVEVKGADGSQRALTSMQVLLPSCLAALLNACCSHGLLLRPPFPCCTSRLSAPGLLIRPRDTPLGAALPGLVPLSKPCQVPPARCCGAWTMRAPAADADACSASIPVSQTPSWGPARLDRRVLIQLCSGSGRQRQWKRQAAAAAAVRQRQRQPQRQRRQERQGILPGQDVEHSDGLLFWLLQ